VGAAHLTLTLTLTCEHEVARLAVRPQREQEEAHEERGEEREHEAEEGALVLDEQHPPG